MSERHEASRAIQRSRAQAAHARERWYDERLEHDRYSSGSECSRHGSYGSYSSGKYAWPGDR